MKTVSLQTQNGSKSNEQEPVFYRVILCTSHLAHFQITGYRTTHMADLTGVW